MAPPTESIRLQKMPAGGIHGSTCTAQTFAIVGGGHPAVSSIGESIARRSPALRDRSPTLAGALRLELPNADGLDLAEQTVLESAG